jgi:hypothetical protein
MMILQGLYTLSLNVCPRSCFGDTQTSFLDPTEVGLEQWSHGAALSRHLAWAGSQEAQIID